MLPDSLAHPPTEKKNKPLTNFNYELCKINTNDMSPLNTEIGTMASSYSVLNIIDDYQHLPFLYT